MPIDFTGTDTSVIYNPGYSAANADYLLQLLGPYGIKSADQLAQLSDADIQKLINQVVQDSAGAAPSSGAYQNLTGGPTTSAPGATTGVSGIDPATGTVAGTPASRGGPTPGQVWEMNGGNGSYTQKSDGTIVWTDPVSGEERPWKPEEGVPSDLAKKMEPNSGMDGPLPGTDYPNWKDPETNTNRPVPTNIQGFVTDPNADVFADEHGYRVYHPALGYTDQYDATGKPLSVTQVDAQGNYITTNADGTKTLVDRNGWSTSWDAQGNVTGHWEGNKPGVQPTRSNLANPDPRVSRVAYANYKTGLMDTWQQMASNVRLGPDPSIPHNPRQPGDTGMPYNPPPATMNPNSTFGSWGTGAPGSGGVQGTAEKPTPTASTDGTTGGVEVKKIWDPNSKSYMDYYYDPNYVPTPNQGYKGVDTSGRQWSVDPEKVFGPQSPDPGVPAYPGAPAPATGNPPTAGGNPNVQPPVSTQPPAVQPPASGYRPPLGVPTTQPPASSAQPPAGQPPAGPPQAGIEPPEVLYGGGGEVRPMPGPGRPTGYGQPQGQPIHQGQLGGAPQSNMGGNWVRPYTMPQGAPATPGYAGPPQGWGPVQTWNPLNQWTHPLPVPYTTGQVGTPPFQPPAPTPSVPPPPPATTPPAPVQPPPVQHQVSFPSQTSSPTTSMTSLSLTPTKTASLPAIQPPTTTTSTSQTSTSGTYTMPKISPMTLPKL